jgi:hypothetical protein
MRARRFKAFGDNSVLELTEVAAPTVARRWHWCGSWRARLIPATSRTRRRGHEADDATRLGAEDQEWGGSDAWVPCVSPHGAGDGRLLWPCPGPLSGAAADRSRRALRYAGRVAGGRDGQAPFRATRSGLHPRTRWAAPRVPINLRKVSLVIGNQ